MNNEQFSEWLRKHNACDSALNMVGEKTAQEVWDGWEKPTELLWWVERSGVVSKQELTLLTCGIVRNTPLYDGRTVWDLLTDERSRNAIETVERWASGNATDEELQMAERGAAAVAWAAEEEAWAAAWAAAKAAGAEAAKAAEAAVAVAWAAAEAVAWAAAEAWAARVVARTAAAWTARAWQLAYIREQLPDFVERFTKANS